MKKHALQILSGLLVAVPSFLGWTSALAQQAELVDRKALSVRVGVNHTVSVRFPRAITSVDRGSAQLLAQKVVSAENVLLLKAANPKMLPTSLMVITEDGALYSFQVEYTHQAVPISLELLACSSLADHSGLCGTGDLPAFSTQQQLCRAESMPANLSLKASAQGISAHIDGLYVAGSKIYLRVSIENQSQIGYELASIHFSVADKARAKRTASQQKQIIPLLEPTPQRVIQAGSQLTMLIPLAKLTINRKKYLAVQIHEKNGERNLDLRLKARHFRQIKAL